MNRGIDQLKNSNRKRKGSLTEGGPGRPGSEPATLKRKWLIENDPHRPGTGWASPSIPQSSTLPSVLDYPADLLPPSAPSPTTSLRNQQAPSPLSIPLTTHGPQSILEGSRDFKIENSVLTNVQGNAVIFRFDSGSSPGEEFKSVLVNHMAGFITVRDLDRIEKRTLSQAIRDLPRAKAAYDDYVSLDRRRVTCFEGTRQLLLEEIAQCVGSSHGPRAYLLFGIAGAGKSTVAQTVAERADNLRILGASFFFSRDEADRRNAERFFTTIAFQLCVYDAQFAQAIGTALTEERGAAATLKGPQQQLNALILEPLQAIAKSRSLPIVIVIDALDECNTEDGQTILMALDQLVRKLPFFKVILTTRPQPRLQYLLSSLGAHQLFRLEDIERKIVEGDIRHYLEYSLSLAQVHARLQLKWAANDKEIDYLVRLANRLFIVASTAVRFILNEEACDPESRMKILQSAGSRPPFTSLNDFYAVILRCAVPVGCEHDISERYQAVVGTVMLIQYPLHVGALVNLIDVSENKIRAVLRNLQSVISVGRNDLPLVYHKSFPDYITDDQRCKDDDLHINPKNHHTRLATCCFRVMNRHLKRNILGLRGPSQYFDNEKALMEEKLSNFDVQRAIPSELQYASIHWASHVAQAGLQDSHLAAEFNTFIKAHLLHWLEALSWIRQFGIAYPSLDAVLKHQIMSPDMCQILSDALRFVSRDYQKIEQSALYAYHSALPFTPTESLLYKHYQHEILLCRVIGGPAQWDVQISVNQHGSDVKHIVFAKDSSRFVSCARFNAILWDATNGAPIRTFDGDHLEVTDDFSIFAAARGRSVTIHSASSSAPVASFNHPAKVVRIAISFDGSRLAAGLDGGIIHVWDVEKEALIASLDGYDDSSYGRRMAFSPSGSMLAFTSKDSISLLNGVNIVARLEHEAEKPVTFTFLGDGTRLATLAKKGYACTLRLWNSENGELIAVTRGVGEHLAVSVDGSFVATGGPQVQLWSSDSLALVDTFYLGRISSLAFSGDMFATASNVYRVVTLYDVKTHASISTLQIHLPSSLAFSPDGTRLAAGNMNGSVHLWDVPSIRASAPTPKRKLSPITALSISPDCSRLASGRENGSVELWDTGHMKKAVASHRLHSDRVNALAFSPDCTQLASRSCDRTVRLWDGEDGMQIGILEYSSIPELTSLALSNSLLAAATVEVITLWDRTSLYLICTFKGGSNSLSFSLDGSTLAASYTKPTSSSQSEVATLDTEKLIVTSRFTINGVDTTLFPSPDGSKIAVQYSANNDLRYGYEVYDIINQGVISNPENEDFTWVPHLKRIPMVWDYDCLAGRFSARHHDACVPVLKIPGDFRVRKFTSRSSMFALGCEDDRILLIRPVDAD